MNNLISVFMNYKANRLIEYGVLCFQRDSSFIRNVFSSYFQTYIDNYYYGIFSTIDDENYNKKNLKTELNGIMEEMIYDYQEYEGKIPTNEFQTNQGIIHDLRDIAYEVCRIDTITFPNKDEIVNVMNEFFKNNSSFAALFKGKEEKLIRLIRETYTNESRLLQYENQSFVIEEKKFTDRDDLIWYELVPNIKSLELYRKGLIHKVNNDNELIPSKIECLIQMISHRILLNFLNKQETKMLFMELPSSLIGRGKIDDRIYSLIDNPMFKKYVVLAIPYNTYLSQKGAFSDDFHFACMQDFSHINDIYQKVENIYNEGFCHYLIVTDYKYDDKDFFIKYKNEVMSILMFEEE